MNITELIQCTKLMNSLHILWLEINYDMFCMMFDLTKLAVWKTNHGYVHILVGWQFLQRWENYWTGTTSSISMATSAINMLPESHHPAKTSFPEHCDVTQTLILEMISHMSKSRLKKEERKLQKNI